MHRPKVGMLAKVYRSRFANSLITPKDYDVVSSLYRQAMRWQDATRVFTRVLPRMTQPNEPPETNEQTNPKGQHPEVL